MSGGKFLFITLFFLILIFSGCDCSGTIVGGHETDGGHNIWGERNPEDTSKYMMDRLRLSQMWKMWRLYGIWKE